MPHLATDRLVHRRRLAWAAGTRPRCSEEFDALVEEDRQLDHEAREGMTLVLAIRPWELGLFTELRRRPGPQAPVASAD